MEDGSVTVFLRASVLHCRPEPGDLFLGTQDGLLLIRFTQGGWLLGVDFA